MMRLIIAVYSIIVIVLPVMAESKNLVEAEAVVLAESFIKRNGYTKETASSEQLTYESLERNHDRQRLLEARHNTLQGRAYGVFLGQKGNPSGWSVVFRYTDPAENKNGRAVTMNPDGSNVRVQHTDFILENLDEILRDDAEVSK